MIQGTWPQDQASSPAPRLDAGPLNLLVVYTVMVESNLLIVFSALNNTYSMHTIFSLAVCQPPYQPENGGYACHPSPCGRLSHGTVIQYFCDEGYILKGDYKFRTCQYGKWDNLMPISCLKELGKHTLTVSTKSLLLSSNDEALFLNIVFFSGCIRPSMVPYGSVNLTDTNRGLFPMGTVLQYSCEPDYLLDGPNILSCNWGHWSSEPPRCIHSDGKDANYSPSNIIM